MTYGKTLILRILPKNLTFESRAFKIVPIWIQLPSIPLECWNKKAIAKIASRVGKPICSDKVTNEGSMLGFARVLVEVNISKEPITSFKTDVGALCAPVTESTGVPFAPIVDVQGVPDNNVCDVSYVDASVSHVANIGASVSDAIVVDAP
ncbi:unnamed protein product [Cuscuta epithymum]|uniref:DUF4283 domain-containing protein n=1 Tax=Cuscuta epithymum TaxID=186058 RepID=A0AAV0CLY2_9ASTE|nr:unnamed protein product [Cuscuta epithymum]